MSGPVELWGVWCELDRVWAHVVPFAEGRLEFLSEIEADNAAAQWSNQHGGTWIAKRIGSK
jgi:hypothetical protein